ncbi:MAG TPA: cytochrome c [Candidatus Sulfotelmatobacter sp.]|nr:cytochrome c [Candidatus Sulfotelmatobacter sp.]
MLALSATNLAAAERAPLLGHAPTPTALAAADIDVRGQDGQGLPPGRGSVAAGEPLFANLCAACHGDFGEGIPPYPALTGGRGTLDTNAPVRSVGSFWPYAPTLFDYIRRAMPFRSPGSLDNDQVYSLVAYVLYLNDLLAKNATLDAASLAAVRMPNRDGFVSPDPRPDVKASPCMQHCRSAPVKIISDSADRAGAAAPKP